MTEVATHPGARPRYVMFDGELVGYGAARLHVLSPALKYGIAVFEGGETLPSWNWVSPVYRPSAREPGLVGLPGPDGHR